MKKQLVKYITALSGIIFLSSSDIGKDTRIMIGPISVSPHKIVKPVKDAYKDIKKVVTMKKKKKKWYE
jgi:hypothetical protein|tara:strand:+ start:33 stop:236 length:204 start_codon:yes stop_codon:yes gene_type:complete